VAERLRSDLADSPFGDCYESADGHLAVPQGPGLVIDPDPAILDKLSVA
jgi:L-alanine-DL-glutamate epimerase-like enolase superfamily enzyme